MTAPLAPLALLAAFLLGRVTSRRPGRRELGAGPGVIEVTATVISTRRG